MQARKLDMLYANGMAQYYFVWIAVGNQRNRSLLCFGPSEFFINNYHSLSLIITEKNAKLEHLDEGMIKELAGDDDEGDDGQEKVAQTKQSKAKAQVERRLAAEKKKASTKSTNGKKKKGSKGDDGGDEDDDDDEDALMTFAKGSREKQKKR